MITPLFASLGELRLPVFEISDQWSVVSESVATKTNPVLLTYETAPCLYNHLSLPVIKQACHWPLATDH
jgi:hypothetical protein